MCFGARKPNRTWLPLTPSTVSVTSLPIITDSPVRLIKMSIVLSSSYGG